MCFPFPGIFGGAWVFLARPSPTLIFSDDGKGEVTGVAGDSDSKGADASSDGVEGRDLGGWVFFVYLQ